MFMPKEGGFNSLNTFEVRYSKDFKRSQLYCSSTFFNKEKFT